MDDHPIIVVPADAAKGADGAAEADVKLSRFEVRRKLGEGGMGIVYEAYDRELRTNVALKTFLRFGPRQLYRLKQEFRALAELTHRNLVTLYELILVDDTGYISMELIDGAESFLEHVRPNASHAAAKLNLESLRHGYAAPATQTGDDIGATIIDDAAPPSQTQPTRDLEWTKQPTPPSVADPTTQIAEVPHVAVTSMTASAPDAPRLQSISIRNPALRRNPLSGTVLDMSRLRGALRQICQGVHALHRMGKIHRDLKPRNVLVDSSHRVVICDFGLVTEIKEEKGERGRGVEGTLAYMSPEQAKNERLTFASDWFAVGVMLYEALTTQRPFAHRDLEEIRAAHAQGQLVPPRQISPDAPEDLERLCCDLLAIEPEDRPTGGEVLTRLGVTAPTLKARRASDRPLFGRTAQLTSLLEAYDATRKGKTVVQFVRGDPGIGKSALAARFRDVLPTEVAEDVVTLSARCYASESVPYNAIDGLIDALSGYFKSLPAQSLRALLPAGIAELARLFPVLQWVDAVSELTSTGPQRVDEHERRRQAFSALTEIFRRIAADRSLLLFIDNFQHCDRDSARLLVHILDSQPQIPLMLLACEKHQERGQSWFVRQLGRRQQQGTWSGNIEVREMTLTPLSVPQSRALARLLLESDESFHIVETTMKEAGGNPLYLEELAAAWARRRARAATMDEAARDADLKKYAERMKIERVLLEPTHSLSADTRALLRTAAVAGRPMPQGILYQAAELGEGRRRAANTLRTERLIRVEGLRESDRIEIAHDGLKTAVLSTLAPPVLEKLHRKLATAMVAAQSQDHEALAEHWIGAGEQARARAATITAAGRAAHALAFDRASRLYRMALDLRVPDSHEEDRQLRHRLADALAASGHSVEAATAFLAAGRNSNAAEAIECRRRATELYFQSGLIDEGMTVLYEALEYYGMSVPSSDARARLSRAWLRARTSLRGYRHRAKDESEVPDVENKRADLCTSVLLMLGMVNGDLGSQLQAHNLLRSLDVGEPMQLARAIALEPVYASVRYHKARSKEARSATLAGDMASASDDPSTIAFVKGATALWHYQRARFDDARALSEQALELQKTAARTGSFEANTVRLINLWSLYYLGHVEEFVTRVRSQVQDAEARGDSFMFANLCAGVPGASWLLANDMQGAEWSATEAVNAWPTRADRHIQGYWEAFALAQTQLYSGTKGLAWKQLARTWPQIVEGAFMRMPFVAAEAWHLRARCAIDAAAAGTREQVPMMRQARRAASALVKCRTPLAKAWAKLIRAGVRYIEGHRSDAIQLLSDAENELENLGMRLYAIAARQRRGELLRSNAGQLLIDESKELLTDQRIANPQAVVACLAPGFPASATHRAPTARQA